MKRWLKRALLVLCVTMLGITAAAFVGCSSCNDDGNSSSSESSVSAESSVGANSSTSGTGDGTCEHAWVETVVEATCYADGSITKECSKCGEVVHSTTLKVACSYEKTTVAATCMEDGYDQFTCKWCNDTYKNVTARATGHDTEGAVWTAGEDVQVDGCTYAHVETAKCNDCQETVTFTEEFKKHTYTVSSITHATCAEAGEKTYTCACGDSYTEEIAIDANAHTWDGGATEGNVTTYTCTHASAHTKKVYSAKEETVATVPADVLEETGAVELKNAEMKMDAATLEAIGGKEVTIAAETLDSVEIADEYADKFAEIGGGKIFDFTMTANGEAVDFNGGKITVTVPYDLADGEDPDNIAIWYIGKDGKPETIAATYSFSNGQGYATFETSHFSVYTVVRLSLEERCELYGHKFVTRTVPAVCGQQGYTVTECTRCHKYERSAFTPALVHSYNTAVTAATCSAMGYTTYTCSLCGDKYVSDYTAKLSHTYAETVIAPTCTADGYTLHKCSLCGESYTDTPVSATGHNYVNDICSVCGRKNPSATANFYFNLIDSLANADTFYFEVKGLKASMEQTYNNGDVEIMVYEMNLARAQIGFDETGIVGKGEGTLTGMMKETGSANYEEKYFATAQFLFTNGNMYIYVDGTGLDEGDGRVQMVMSAPQSMMTAEMEDETGMSMEMLMEMAEAYGSGALDIIAGMANVSDNPLNSAIKAVVEYIYTKTETANGYSFELNENRLKDMYEILMTKSVSEIFNLIFGADAYQKTQAWLAASVDKTIPQFEEEVKTELVNWGISLDEVYDYIDSIMFAGMEVPEGTPAPSVRDYIHAEELKEVTLLDIINMAMGEMLEEPLTADAVKKTINDYGEQLGALKMSDIMGMMGGMGGSASKDSAMTKPMVEKEEEEEAPEIDVEAIIDAYVAFLNKIPVTFTTDKDGALIDFSMSMNNLDPMEIVGALGMDEAEDVIAPIMSATVRFVLNGTYAGEYDHIVREAEKLAGANDIKEDIITEDIQFYVEEDATYVMGPYSHYYERQPVGTETYNGVECTKIEFQINNLYILDEESKDIITAKTDCHGWWEISIQAYDFYYVTAYAYKNAEGKIIGTEIDRDTLKGYNYTTGVEIFYNPTTGEYAGNSQHNYKKVKSVAEAGCTEAYDLYVCSVCGVEYIDEDYETGHNFVDRYVLAEGSKTCEDGALCEYYCTKCGRVDHSYETKYHNYNYENKLVYTSPVCGAVYVRVGECPCGEKSTVSDPYSWTMDCQPSYVKGEWIETEGTEYTYHYITTYACPIEGCGFTYTKEELEWYEYNAMDEDGYTCKHYDVDIYDFGNGVKYEYRSWGASHRTTSSSIGNSYGGTTSTYTCTLCNQVTEIETRDQYGRIIRVEYPINGPESGWYRVWTGCNYQEYSLDNDPQGSGTQHHWTWQDDKTNCTQYAPDSEYCYVCGETRGTYQAPDHWWSDDHSYYYDWNLETYVCRRCGTHNETGADGWIVLEDMVEGNELKVGYFNKHDFWWSECRYAFDKVQIEVIANYNPDDEENPGVVLEGDLYDREVTSPIGYREAGIITLDHEALGNAINNAGISVKTVSVVFWIELTSETTGESYVVGYGLTFTLDELGLA